MPKLVVQDVDRAWLLDLPLGEGVLIGRAAACDVRIKAPRASRRHCEIVSEGGGHVVRDLGSTNRTLVQSAPIAAAVPLADGYDIEVGGCRLTYWSRP